MGCGIIGEGIAKKKAAAGKKRVAIEDIVDDNGFGARRAMHFREEVAHAPLPDNPVHFVMRRAGNDKGRVSVFLQQLQGGRDASKQGGGHHAVKHRGGKAFAGPLQIVVRWLLASNLLVTVPQFLVARHPAMGQVIPHNILLHFVAKRSEQLGKGQTFHLG